MPSMWTAIVPLLTGWQEDWQGSLRQIVISRHHEMAHSRLQVLFQCPVRTHARHMKLVTLGQLELLLHILSTLKNYERSPRLQPTQ